MGCRGVGVVVGVGREVSWEQGGGAEVRVLRGSEDPKICPQKFCAKMFFRRISKNLDGWGGVRPPNFWEFFEIKELFYLSNVSYIDEGFFAIFKTEKIFVALLFARLASLS